MDAIEKAASFSNSILDNVRSSLAGLDSNRLVVTCGSYARREASISSDMDYYSIVGELESAEDQVALDNKITEIVSTHVPKPPSKDGAFAINISEQDLLENYGGSRDSNESITRRMLYLLEGEYLTDQERFSTLKRKVIERYVANTPRDHQIAFYLLNDIVRYWRTLAVDYADKTYGAKEPKPWPVRNIKLVFSRKLIYASGIFSVALTADRTEVDKVEILSKLFDLTPMKRLEYVSGSSAVHRVRDMYSFFLDQISSADTRQHLDGLSQESAKNDPVFRRLKNEGHYFSRELMGLLARTFHPSHPIHMALIF